MCIFRVFWIVFYVKMLLNLWFLLCFVDLRMGILVGFTEKISEADLGGFRGRITFEGDNPRRLPFLEVWKML